MNAVEEFVMVAPVYGPTTQDFLSQRAPTTQDFLSQRAPEALRTVFELPSCKLLGKIQIRKATRAMLIMELWLLLTTKNPCLSDHKDMNQKATPMLTARRNQAAQCNTGPRFCTNLALGTCQVLCTSSIPVL